MLPEDMVAKQNGQTSNPAVFKRDKLPEVNILKFISLGNFMQEGR
jgi:hypothetical protein